MNDPHTHCPVCGQSFSVCQCERDEEWDRAVADAEAEWGEDRSPGCEYLADEDDFDQDDMEDHKIEQSLENCGQQPDGSCLLSGSEYCDFICPFRKV